MSETSSKILKEVHELFNLSKLFFSFRRMKVIAGGGHFAAGTPRTYLLFNIFFPFILSAYSFILVVFVVPPPATSSIELNPEAFSLKVLFGTGINLVGFFVLLLFGIALITSLLTIRTNFLNSPQAELIHSSPYPLYKLLLGELLSSSISRDYFICVAIVSFYLVYRLWVNLPLYIVDIPMLIIFGLILSLTGGLFGVSMGINSLDDWKEMISSKSFLVIISTILISVITLSVDIFLQQSMFQAFSPLGWITLGVYSLFSRNNPEFQLTIFLAGLMLLLAAIIIPRRLPSEYLYFKDKIFYRKTGFFQKSMQKIICRFYSGDSKDLATIMLLEEWEKKRPLKFLAMTTLAIFLFLLFQPIFERGFPTEFSVFIPFGTFLFCSLAPLSSIIYQELSYSFFNIDGRFLFYRSTPSGVSKIAIMRLSFILLWETPLIIITSLVATLINPTIYFIMWFSLAVSAVLLVTCTELVLLCLRPHYHLSSFIQIEDRILTMILVVIIVLLLTVVSSSVVLGVPQVLIIMLLPLFAILSSFISVQ
ncbi:MAG: hypothetical protein ACFFAJ_10025 [Candidatus Hodarchaeota archaeon]